MTRIKAPALAALLLSSSLLMGAAPLSQPGAPDIVSKGAPIAPTTITVSGTGEVERKPDYAVVVVGVQMRDASASKASQDAGEKMSAVADALKGLNLAGMQLQTSSVSLNPAYIWRQDDGLQQQQLVGYDASSTLRVRLDDPTKIGAVIDAAIKAGANRIHGISFELKGALEARQEALTMAARAARTKAETLAAALGLRVTTVVTATTSGDDRPPWQPMAMANEARFQDGGGLGGTIEPGMVTVRAEATVTFRAE